MDKLQELSAPIGLLLLSMIFIFSGFTKITDYAATQGYMESMGVPGMLLPLVIAVELLGGIAILLGFKARLVAILMAGFSIVPALIFHQFWIDESQMNPFMKNIAMAGGLGLIALAIRNTASKTVIKHMSPTVLMTGNTTQLGINLTDYLRNRTADNGRKLAHSSVLVVSFLVGALVGALLYMQLNFWAVGVFVLPVLYLAVMARDKGFLEHIA